MCQNELKGHLIRFILYSFIRTCFYVLDKANNSKINILHAAHVCIWDVNTPSEPALNLFYVQASLDDGKKRELQAVIQSYFKDWLMTSGNMRQVYDLARMEREEASSSMPDNSNNLGPDGPMNMSTDPPL